MIVIYKIVTGLDLKVSVFYTVSSFENLKVL